MNINDNTIAQQIKYIINQHIYTIRSQQESIQYITVPIYIQCLGCMQNIGYPLYHTSIFAFNREINYTRYKNGTTSENIPGIEITSLQQGKQRRKLKTYKIYKLSTPVNGQRFADIIQALIPHYYSNDYSVFTHNCNHFTRDFLYLLDPKIRLPNEIFRINTIAYYFQQFKSCSKKQKEVEDQYEQSNQLIIANQ